MKNLQFQGFKVWLSRSFSERFKNKGEEIALKILQDINIVEGMTPSNSNYIRVSVAEENQECKIEVTFCTIDTNTLQKKIIRTEFYPCYEEEAVA